MAKCPKCGERKGKRFCPALEREICSICCGTLRRREIDCPDDCPYLGTGERFQEDKRFRKGAVRGREYLVSRMRAFPVAEEMAFIVALESRAFLYLREREGIPDAEVRAELEAVRSGLGTVMIAGRSPGDLARGLLRDIREHPEFEPHRSVSRERRVRLVERWIRLLPAGDGEGGVRSRRYYEFIRRYFEEALPAASRWSPATAEPDAAPGERRSAGGIILP